MRSLRGARSWPWGFACALSYGYMVAAWGAYTFVLNMIGVHAALLVLLGKFTPKLHHAYSAFYVVGTALALQRLIEEHPLTIGSKYRGRTIPELLRKDPPLISKWSAARGPTPVAAATS